VVTCLVEHLWPHLAIWEHGLRGQQTELLWDVAVVDGTDCPSPGYLERLRAWSRSCPFGPTHRVRLLRVGLDAEGTMYHAPGGKLAHARELLWEKFGAWSSYEYLLTASLDVALPPGVVQHLYEADQEWAVALTPDAARPLRLSLLSGRLVRRVPFRAALDDDLGYCRCVAGQGVYPALVPVT
jgi:hypothetical protein